MPRRLVLSVVGVVALLVAAAPAGHGPLVGPVDRLAAAAEPAASAARGFVLRQPQAEPTSPTLSPSGRVNLADLRSGDEITIEDFGQPLILASAKQPLRRQIRRAGESRVVVPALGAAMPLKASPTKSRRMAVPSGVQAVGWSTSTARPGAKRGTALLATHKDGARASDGGRGVRSPLYDAPTLSKGQRVIVRWKGTRTVYRVTRTTSHRKDRLSAGLVRRGGPHRVALVMCGGPLRVGPDGVLRWTRAEVVWAKAVPKT